MPEGAGRLFDGKAGDAVSYDAVQRINLTVDRERDDAGITNREARTLRNLIQTADAFRSLPHCGHWVR